MATPKQKILLKLKFSATSETPGWCWVLCMFLEKTRPSPISPLLLHFSTTFYCTFNFLRQQQHLKPWQHTPTAYKDLFHTDLALLKLPSLPEVNWTNSYFTKNKNLLLSGSLLEQRHELQDCIIIITTTKIVLTCNWNSQI